MIMKELKTPSLKDVFVSHMEELILTGELETGSKLPTERELADGMNVSRQVISSGIDELKRKGFVHVVPRHGMYVSDYRATGNIDTLNAIMEFRGKDLRKQEVRSLLEIRWGLERMALLDAIENAEDSEIQELREILDNLKRCGSYENAAQYGFKYLHKQSIIGRNMVIPLIYASFENVIVMMMRRFVSLYGIPQLYENLEKTWNYIAERDAEGAMKWSEELVKDVICGDHMIYND